MLDLTKYKTDDFIDIPFDDWETIKKNYDKEIIKEELASILVHCPIPLPSMNEDDVKNDYLKLKGTWWNDILMEGDWFPREDSNTSYHYNFNGSQFYFRKVNTGNDSSKYFHLKNRWGVDHARNPSAIRSWKTKKGIKGALNALFTLKGLDVVNKKTIRTSLALRKYIASQFKPSVAKAFYDRFESKNILDFSAGWGDRLAGFYASNSGEVYVGLDPNTMNHPIYKKQIEFYEHHRTFFEVEKRVELHDTPAEDFDFSGYVDFFDTVFTSPPYFDIERYSNEETQSWVRYKTIDEWNTQFLHKTLKNIIPTIKKDGILAINISDVYSHGQWNSITDPMNTFLDSMGLDYMGCMGMELTKRPNSGGAGMGKTDHFSDETNERAEEVKDKTFGEPIFIWKKTII
jgi:hypothetical protein